MPRNVAIVFEGDFSAQLGKLAFHTPVWLVDTPANRTAAEAAWHAAMEWPHITVTLFPPQDWQVLVDQIAFRERTVEGLEVIGHTLTVEARAALSGAGFDRVDETPNGFRAKRG